MIVQYFCESSDYEVAQRRKKLPLQYNKAAELSVLLPTFKMEFFKGLRFGVVSIKEPPITLPQATVFISSRFSNSTTQPEPPVVNTFNCVINASMCCIDSSSMSSQILLHISEMKKVSTASLSIGLSSLTAMLIPSFKFDVSLNSNFTEEIIFSRTRRR